MSFRNLKLGLVLGVAAFVAALNAGPVPANKPASYPDWWFERDVIRRVDLSNPTPSWPSSYATADDYAVANIGQLKYIASRAASRMELCFSGGAGAEIDALLATWSTPATGRDDFAALNQGQLKAVAAKFYQRLKVLGYSARPLVSGQNYPWTSATTDDDSFANVNLGQLKYVFGFLLINLKGDEPSLDMDGDGLWDGDETALGLLASNPDFDNDFIPDGWEVFYGLNAKAAADADADPDGDHLVTRLEYFSGRIPTRDDQDVSAKLFAGGGQIFFQTDSGSLFGWGDNLLGQVGTLPSTVAGTPTLLTYTGRIVAAAAGRTHGLGLLKTGQVLAWGDNEFGQLGDGSTTSRSTAQLVPGLTEIVQLAAGDGFSLALKGDGTVWTWGANQRGQLGDGTRVSKLSPVQLAGMSDILQIAAGSRHCVALDRQGRVWAWGANEFAQLGLNGAVAYDQPQLLPGLSGCKRIAAGRHHTGVLSAAGVPVLWGANYSGQLGRGDRVGSSTPQPAGALIGVADLALGGAHSIALLSNAGVAAWGAGGQGQLGQGAQTLSDSSDPIAVPGLTGVTRIAAGQAHAVALTSSASILIWGDNDQGRLGLSPATPIQAAPAPVQLP